MPKDPVCGMKIDVAVAARMITYNSVSYVFCAPGCLQAFLRNPERYLEAKPPRGEHDVKDRLRVSDKGSEHY